MIAERAPSCYLPNTVGRAPLIVLFVAAVGVRLALFTGIVGQDDHFMIALAHSMAEGDFGTTPHHMWMRLGVLVPLAITGKLTGWHPWAYPAYAFLCSLGTIALVYRIGRAWFSPQAGYAAAWVLAFFPNNIHYAGAVHVDVPSSFWFLWAIHLLWPERPGTAGTIRPKPLLAAWCLGMAYLCKEVVVLGFVWLAIWFVLDRGSRRRLLWAGIVFGSIVLLEAACYGALTGDPIHRLHAASSGAAPDAQTGASQGLERWLWAYPRTMFLKNGYVGILFHLLVAAVAVHAARRERGWGFLLGWIAVTLALIMWFPGRLNPPTAALNVASRYLEPLAPPAALLIGLAVARSARLQPAAVAALALYVAIGAAGAWAVKRDADRAIEPLRFAARVLDRERATVVVSDRWSLGILSILARFDPSRRLESSPSSGAYVVDYPYGPRYSGAFGGSAAVSVEGTPIAETPDIRVYRVATPH